MNECYICLSELNETNKSQEHIIINAIGGRLKSKDLICKNCNNKYGDSIDSQLAKELHYFSSHFIIKRDRGEVPIVKKLKNSKNEEFDIIDGRTPRMSKPEIDVKEKDGEVNISIRARNEKELLKILNGLKKKFPQIDLEKAKEKFIRDSYYLKDPLSIPIQIGDDASFKSICKTSLNFYFLKTNLKRDYVLPSINFLKSESKENPVEHFYPEKRIIPQKEGEILHSILLKGDRANKLLYCFVEFFSTFSFLIRFSNKFNDESFEHSYCYDVLKNEEVEKSMELNLTRDEFEEREQKIKIERIHEKINRSIGIGLKKHAEFTQDEVLKRSIKKALKDVPEGAIITEEILKNLTNIIAEDMVEFLVHNKLIKE